MVDTLVDLTDSRCLFTLDGIQYEIREGHRYDGSPCHITIKAYSSFVEVRRGGSMFGIRSSEVELTLDSSNATSQANHLTQLIFYLYIPSMRFEVSYMWFANVGESVLGLGVN
ncbi:MAG: hypothetical protein EOP04_04710 [Proteobacteria bacterium]|nr:MAG: hypothetical protein EOP04_04710 [Pseudomonadota bacterium]